MSKQPKAVTTAQLEQVRKMSNEKGVYRDPFQKALDDGTVACVLDAIRDGLSVNIGTILTPPHGGRLHIVRVPVVADRDWNEAINAAGPNTPPNYNVRKVGGSYPVTDTETHEVEIVLINFGSNGGNWDQAIAWAQQFGLVRTNPRQVFAIGEHKPNLPRELGINPIYVVATEECVFGGRRQACGVWWLDAERRASLDWVSNYGDVYDWFAFVRK